MADVNKPSKYVSLKDLIPLHKVGTLTPPYPGNFKTRYVKIKEPFFKDGVKIYWQEVRTREEDNDTRKYSKH